LSAEALESKASIDALTEEAEKNLEHELKKYKLEIERGAFILNWSVNPFLVRLLNL